MAQNPGSIDVTSEIGKEADQKAERIGEVEEARFKPAPDEVTAEVEQTLSRSFPEPESKMITGR